MRGGGVSRRRDDRGRSQCCITNRLGFLERDVLSNLVECVDCGELIIVAVWLFGKRHRQCA
jgi:hypothetical protein